MQCVVKIMPDGEDWYDTAQICINGHVITQFAVSQPNNKSAFCKDCGKATIMECPSCKKAIRGYHHIRLVSGLFEYNAPNFCVDCGKPYPWTETRLEAAKELADLFENINEKEREMLKQNLDDIVRETPRTQVAALIVKKILVKAGIEAVNSFKDQLFTIVVERAKEIIWAA